MVASFYKLLHVGVLYLYFQLCFVNDGKYVVDITFVSVYVCCGALMYDPVVVINVSETLRNSLSL